MGLKLKDIFPLLIRDINKIEREVIKKGGKKASKLFEKDIIESIERGVSPVEGEKRFVKYSDSYTDAIKNGRYSGKKLRPVNLKLEGDLLKSIKSKITSKGIDISFTKKTKKGENLAEIHSFEGAGKSKTIRMMIPDKEGDFKKSVKLDAKNSLIKTTNEVLARQLRRLK